MPSLLIIILLVVRLGCCAVATAVALKMLFICFCLASSSHYYLSSSYSSVLLFLSAVAQLVVHVTSTPPVKLTWCVLSPGNCWRMSARYAEVRQMKDLGAPEVPTQARKRRRKYVKLLKSGPMQFFQILENALNSHDMSIVQFIQLPRPISDPERHIDDLLRKPCMMLLMDREAGTNLA
jgi:hypothetical protein